MRIIVSVFKIVFTLIFFNRTTLQVILFLVWYFGLLRFFSHVVQRFGEFLLFYDGFVCCCLLSIIASLSVELVFLSAFFLIG